MLCVGRSYFAGGIHAAGQAQLTCRNKHEGNTHTSHGPSPLFLVLLIPMASPSEYPPSGYTASCNDLERKRGVKKRDRQRQSKEAIVRYNSDACSERLVNSHFW
jgi:hypothetical protein